MISSSFTSLKNIENRRNVTWHLLSPMVDMIGEIIRYVNVTRRVDGFGRRQITGNEMFEAENALSCQAGIDNCMKKLLI